MLFTLVCYGGAMPDSTNSNNMTLSWKDNSISLQTATQISNSLTVLYSTVLSFGIIPTITYKRFNSEGFMSFYSFKIIPGIAITQNARIYF
jgi:hypothetical protein